MATGAIEAVVSGRVQGVGFRAWTRREATGLGLRGHAVNLPDGRVEIHAEGEVEACDALVGLLRGGATPGSVSGVEVRVVPDSGVTGFETG